MPHGTSHALLMLKGQISIRSGHGQGYIILSTLGRINVEVFLAACNVSPVDDRHTVGILRAPFFNWIVVRRSIGGTSIATFGNIE